MPFHAGWRGEGGPALDSDVTDIPDLGTDVEQEYMVNQALADLGGVAVARILLGTDLVEAGLGVVGIVAKPVAGGQEVVGIAGAGNCIQDNQWLRECAGTGMGVDTWLDLEKQGCGLVEAWLARLSWTASHGTQALSRAPRRWLPLPQALLSYTHP